MNLCDMTWPLVDALDRDTPVVFPIAALEQHGRHMPLFTDSLLLAEILGRVHRMAVAANVLFAPLQWLGNSHHHLDMPGTLSASARCYLDLLDELAESFLAHRFRRIVFLNGHGGNTIPSQQAIFELRQKYRQHRDLLLSSLTYWDSVDVTGSVAGLVQKQMGHACEWETSMMLAIRPDLVMGELGQLPEVVLGAGGAPAYRAWTMPDRSAPGHLGNPAAATAEKGAALLKAFANGVAGFLERVVAWDGRSWDL
jgi:creatinine amidohydrolase